jgi:hypothetical protein
MVTGSFPVAIPGKLAMSPPWILAELLPRRMGTQKVEHSSLSSKLRRV